jgi:antitoxin ParD1/3/4
LKHELPQDDIKRLRQMWDEGVTSGTAGKVDMKKSRKEARRRLEAAKKAPGKAD